MRGGSPLRFIGGTAGRVLLFLLPAAVLALALQQWPVMVVTTRQIEGIGTGAVLEIGPDRDLNQTFRATGKNIMAVALVTATGAAPPEGQVTVSVSRLENPGAPVQRWRETKLREASALTSELQDWGNSIFRFEPLGVDPRAVYVLTVRSDSQVGIAGSPLNAGGTLYYARSRSDKSLVFRVYQQLPLAETLTVFNGDGHVREMSSTTLAAALLGMIGLAGVVLALVPDLGGGRD